MVNIAEFQASKELNDVLANLPLAMETIIPLFV